MKRRLCAFLAAAVCAMSLSGAALAAEASLHTDYVAITSDGFAADSMDGVDAIYNLTISSPDCLEYVQRYYRERYGLTVQATGHDIRVTNTNEYWFEPTSTPQPGDVGYASAAERGTYGGHYVMCKQADPAADTITLIEQNWIWNGQAGVNRTISYSNSCYTFYTLRASNGDLPQAQTPSADERMDDEREASNGALPSAPLSAAAGSMDGMLRSAADVLGSGTQTGAVSDWAETAMNTARTWGIEAGASINTSAAITRGQFARLLANTAYGLGLSVDLSAPQAAVASLGLMVGDSQGNFNAEGTLTREMAAVVLSRLWQLTGDFAASDESVLARYNDGAKISTWAKPGVSLATAAGLINGTGSGFSPAGQLTCEQAVVLLARLFAARIYYTL